MMNTMNRERTNNRSLKIVRCYPSVRRRSDEELLDALCGESSSCRKGDNSLRCELRRRPVETIWIAIDYSSDSSLDVCPRTSLLDPFLISSPSSVIFRMISSTCDQRTRRSFSSFSNFVRLHRCRQKNLIHQLEFTLDWFATSPV